MEKIAIFGAGGLGREVYCLIQAINKIKPTWDFIGFFDDGNEKGTFNEYGEILGGINEVNNYNNPLSLVIAIGNGAIIEKIVFKITNDYISYPNIIAPSVIFYDYNSAKLGIGNVIVFYSSISCNVEIGNFNILNGFISIGHDTAIGSFNSIMPGVRISGNVKIDNNNFIGTNAVVLPQQKIGCNVVIGAGSVVVRKTQDNFTYTGNPATKFKF